MRIAIFSEVYWPMVSGVGVTLLRLTEALQARGHVVRVYSASYPVPEGGDRPEVHRSLSMPFFLYPDVQWAFPRLRDIMDDLAAFRPDVVHVATEFAMGVAGVKAAARLGVPVVASAHTDYERYASRYRLEWGWLQRFGWRYLRWFYGHAERVLCPSRIYEEHLHARGVDRTGLWSRGVCPRRFHPRFRRDAWRSGFGAGPQDPVVTYVGRLAREKNLHLLLDAWEQLGTGRGSGQLVLVGTGPLEEEIRRRRIPGVHMTGLLQDDALATAYASADLFAFPSTTETFGNVVLEAMASGLPCVVAAAGGVLEFAHHGANAWLVAPDDARALTTGIERLLRDEALARRLRAGALRTAASRSWDAIYDGLEAEYRQAAGRAFERAA